jgi:hypothetical protein
LSTTQFPQFVPSIALLLSCFYFLTCLPTFASLSALAYSTVL